MRTFCPTRWTVRHGSINSILSHYQTLITILDTVQQGHDEYAAKVKSLLTQMDSFDTFYNLKLAYLVYSAAEQLSVNLPAKNTTVNEGLNGSCLLVEWLKSMRNETAFESFYGGVVVTSEGLTDESVRMSLTSPTSPRWLSSKIDTARLRIQLGMLPAAITTAHEGTSVTSDQPQNFLVDPRTLADTLNQSAIYKGMLGEVDKLLHSYFTFPVTNALQKGPSLLFTESRHSCVAL